MSGGGRASLQVLRCSQLRALANYWKIMPLKHTIIVKTDNYYESDTNILKWITALYLFKTLTQSSLPNPCNACKNLVDNSHKAPSATLYLID